MADPRIVILDSGDKIPEPKIPVLTAAKVPNLNASKINAGALALANAPAGTVFACPLDGSVGTNANLARPSTRTDIFFEWRMTVLPTKAIQGDTCDLQVP